MLKVWPVRQALAFGTPFVELSTPLKKAQDVLRGPQVSWYLRIKEKERGTNKAAGDRREMIVAG